MPLGLTAISAAVPALFVPNVKAAERFFEFFTSVVPDKIMKPINDQPRVKQDFNGDVLFVRLIGDRFFRMVEHKRCGMDELRAQSKIIVLLVAGALQVNPFTGYLYGQGLESTRKRLLHLGVKLLNIDVHLMQKVRGFLRPFDTKSAHNRNSIWLRKTTAIRSASSSTHRTARDNCRSKYRRM
jgi:hypothetical protein